MPFECGWLYWAENYCDETLVLPKFFSLVFSFRFTVDEFAIWKLVIIEFQNFELLVGLLTLTTQRLILVVRISTVSAVNSCWIRRYNTRTCRPFLHIRHCWASTWVMRLFFSVIEAIWVFASWAASSVLTRPIWWCLLQWCSHGDDTLAMIVLWHWLWIFRVS